MLKVFRGYANWGLPGNNPGDLIVELGAIKLLGSSFGFLDALVVAGTPWFWNGCEQDEKYPRLLAELEGCSDLKIALGIGSCLGKDSGVELLMKDSTMAMSKAVWSKFDLIIVRDTLSQTFLESLGIRSFVLPCPSLFAFEGIPSPRPGSVLFVEAPAFHPEFQEPVFPDISGDVTRYRTTRGAWTVDGINDLLRFYCSHEHIISARIHAAIPCSPFVATSVIPVDSRFETAVLSGVKIYPEVSSPVDSLDVRKKAREAYVEKINEVLNRK